MSIFYGFEMVLKSLHYYMVMEKLANMDRIYVAFTFNIHLSLGSESRASFLEHFCPNLVSIR